MFLPGIHPAVHDWVVHRIGHCQPIERQEYVLYVWFCCQFRHVRRDDEVYVVWQPTDGENRHHDNHHFNHL